MSKKSTVYILSKVQQERLDEVTEQLLNQKRHLDADDAEGDRVAVLEADDLAIFQKIGVDHFAGFRLTDRQEPSGTGRYYERSKSTAYSVIVPPPSLEDRYSKIVSHLAIEAEVLDASPRTSDRYVAILSPEDYQLVLNKCSHRSAGPLTLNGFEIVSADRRTDEPGGFRIVG